MELHNQTLEVNVHLIFAQFLSAVVDCFVGQPKQSGMAYRIDPGRGSKDGQQEMLDDGFKNPGIVIPKQRLLENRKLPFPSGGLRTDSNSSNSFGSAVARRTASPPTTSVDWNEPFHSLDTAR